VKTNLGYIKDLSFNRLFLKEKLGLTSLIVWRSLTSLNNSKNGIVYQRLFGFFGIEE